LDEQIDGLVLTLMLAYNFDPFHIVRRDRNQGKWRIYIECRGYRICFLCTEPHHNGLEGELNRDEGGKYRTRGECVHGQLQKDDEDELSQHVEYSYCKDRNRDI
jgi:hypothetical protein